MNFLGDTTNQPPKFWKECWVGINDESHGTYNSEEIRFKTILLNWSICEYSDVSILVKGTMKTVGAEADSVAIAANRDDKELIQMLLHGKIC